MFLPPVVRDVAARQSSDDPIVISIDVKPGDPSTTIEASREGMIPVVIVSTGEFDATTVDPATIRVGATGTEAAVFRSASEDIDRDGDTDLLLLVRIQQMGLECGDTSVQLKGKTLDGRAIEGSEEVTMEGCSRSR